MWSDWLVFCGCGFQSFCPVMEKGKRLIEASWWEKLTEGEIGSCSDGWGGAMFSKSLIQFSVDVWGCISDIIDISLRNLVSSLCFIQPSIFHDVLCILVKKAENIELWHIPFSIWNQFVIPCPVLTVASWPVYRFLRRQDKRSGIPISLRIFHSLLWSTQRNALA